MRPDATTERRDIQRLLQIGLATAAALMAAGLLVALLSGPPADVTMRVGAPWERDVAVSVRLSSLGILVLAATPALRVLALIMLWIRERDWTYVAVAVAVALVLGVAVALGGR